MATTGRRLSTLRVVLAERALEHGLAGAGLAPDQAEAALLAVHAHDVEHCSTKKSSSLTAPGDRKRMRLMSSARRSSGFMPSELCGGTRLYPGPKLLIERFEARQVELARQEDLADLRKKRSILPLAAPSRTGVWHRMVPRRSHTCVISSDE
jgi:hypothetical protein